MFNSFELRAFGTSASIPLPLLVNVAISAGAFFVGQNLIPKMKTMFLSANLAGIDMNKKSKAKM